MIDTREVHARVAAIVAYGRRSGDFAGVAIERSPPGKVLVGFTRDVERHRAALLETFPYERWLDVFGAKHSLSRLEAVIDELEQNETALIEAGIVAGGVGIDVGANSVWLEIWRPTEEALDWLQSRYGDLVMAVVVPEFERVSLPIRDCHPGAGASVIVSYDTSAGLDIDEVRLDEDDIHVRITLYAHVPPWTDSFKADRRSKKTTIQLARPVGSRSVQIG